MKFKIYSFVVFSLVFCAVFSSTASANNLRITNVHLGARDVAANTAVVEFDVAWDNSWRNDTNYDAVWVFLKVKKGSTWYHGMLNTAGSNPSDTSTGSNQNLDILIPADKVGAFIQRKPGNTVAGSITSTKVQLKLNYGAAPLSAADTDTIQAKVFGIEMTYIPEGAFNLGDGNGSSESTYAFHVTNNTSFQLASSLTSTMKVDAGGSDDSQLTSTGIGISGSGGLDTDNDGTVDNPLFPTGYLPFYLMKYEMSQAQYRDFLNSLSSTEKAHRTATLAGDNYVMSNADSVTYRQGLVTHDGSTVGCDENGNFILDEVDDGCNIAMNYLSWMDLAAYADWSGLRPMTETEFEKAARGPSSAVYGEYAWGSTTITQATTIVNSGKANEGVSQTGNGLSNYNSGVSGPLRVGFAATSATTRATAGAGYYGNMELSGNIYEPVVTVGNSTGRAFLGTHGDGVLAATSSYEGNATNTDWPGINATIANGVTGETGGGLRGGFCSGAASVARLSDRTSAASGSGYWGNGGGRLARSAFSSVSKPPGSVVDDGSYGDVAWTNPGNAAASDDSYATAVVSESITHYLKATNFGFNIPGTATIRGIVIKVERKNDVTVYDKHAQIVKGGAIGTSDKKVGSAWPSVDTNIFYGGAEDLWGEIWTPADINASNFGFVFSGGDGLGTNSVDYIEATVYYTE